MDTETADELQILRSRAYGPSADIDTDASALRRLRELEELAGVATAVLPDTSMAAEAPESVETQEPRTVDLDGPVSAPSTPPTRGPRPRKGLSWRVRLLWATSIVATAGITTAIAFGLFAMTPVPVSSGAPQIATLRPAPLVEIPPGWFGAGPSSRAWEFHGLTLFETTGGMFGTAGGGDCLAVVTAEAIPAEETVNQGSWTISGLAYTACRIGAFPATIAMPVDSNAPDELRTAYPNSALQFVKQGDRIGVFLDQD